MSKEIHPADYYHGINLFADPIHSYIPVTYPISDGEITERDLIDSPWLQRLRRIHQLQSAWWVYPGAEHSRFVHSLGVMHLAGHFARHLYDSLSSTLKKLHEPCPSLALIEETVRVAGLTHDIGHGPFSHFFDDHYLRDFSITHEDISKHIILTELSDTISQLCRSPHGNFEEGESVNPEHVAFIIKKPVEINEEHTKQFPLWVRWLQPLFCGIYTVDNIDYSLRDAFMCGISTKFVDLERLRHYTFFTEKGLTFHHAGLSALEMFLKSRWYLYKNVYYHRTIRGIDLHLAEMFNPTMKMFLKGDPRESLDDYLELTDYSLLETVRQWLDSEDEDKRELGLKWKAINDRKISLKSVFRRESENPAFKRFSHDQIESWIRKYLPANFKNCSFKVDTANHDPRPVNPGIFTDEKIHVYFPATKALKDVPVSSLFPHLPDFVMLLRVYSEHGQNANELSLAAEKALKFESDASSTNV